MLWQTGINEARAKELAKRSVKDETDIMQGKPLIYRFKRLDASRKELNGTRNARPEAAQDPKSRYVKVGYKKVGYAVFDQDCGRWFKFGQCYDAAAWITARTGRETLGNYIGTCVAQGCRCRGFVVRRLRKAERLVECAA